MLALPYHDVIAARKCELLCQRALSGVLESHGGRAPSADSVEKREPVSDIDTTAVDSLKALGLNRPIREADMRDVG